MMGNMNDELLTTNEAAARLGISRQGVHYMAKRAGIAPVARPDAPKERGRRVYWMREDILKLAERRRENLRRAIDKALSGPML